MSTGLRHELLVLDANVGYHLFVRQPGQSNLQSLLNAELAAGCDFVAPTLWRYEVASTITKALQLKRIKQPEATKALELCLAFPIGLIAPSDELTRAAFQWTLKLKRAAAYDSFYLALAQQLACELWTYDQRLANAVQEPWVRYIGQPN